jgi:serine protease SohB
MVWHLSIRSVAVEFFLEIGLFAGKALLIVISIVAILIVLLSLIAKQQKGSSKKLSIENISKRFQGYRDQLGAETDPSGQFVKSLKKQKKAEKKQLKKKSSGQQDEPKIYVIEFEGDIKAAHVKNLREEVSAVLSVADKQRDEICLVLESTGGMVHAYGLAAAQLLRVKNAGIPLTICVDKVAASGGYMMACTADKLMCSPFAIIGSIGVVAQVPNLHKLLKKNSIDYEEMTAGEYKRTVSMLAEITPKGKEKFLQQLDETHVLFKNFVSSNRDKMDMSKVATGEYWYGYQARDLNLVDEISTSDDYLFSKFESHKIFKVSVEAKKNLSEKIADAVSLSFDRFTQSFLQKGHDSEMTQA